MPQSLSIFICIVMLMLVGFGLLVYDHRRTQQALDKLDDKIANYRMLRIELTKQFLTLFVTLVPTQQRLRMTRYVSDYADICDDAAELRWERRWIPEMRRLIDTLDGAVMGTERSTFTELRTAFEKNEGMLTEARNIRQTLVKRPSMIIESRTDGESTYGND